MSVCSMYQLDQSEIHFMRKPHAASTQSSLFLMLFVQISSYIHHYIMFTIRYSSLSKFNKPINTFLDHFVEILYVYGSKEHFKKEKKFPLNCDVHRGRTVTYIGFSPATTGALIFPNA